MLRVAYSRVLLRSSDECLFGRISFRRCHVFVLMGGGGKYLRSVRVIWTARPASEWCLMCNVVSRDWGKSLFTVHVLIWDGTIWGLLG